MKARLLYRIRETYGRGVIEAVICDVPTPLQPSEHRFNYRLAYLVDGKRVVGYDNERGKGDYRHLRDMEMRYLFVDVPTLLLDFMKDVKEIES